MSKVDELIQELCPDGVEWVALGDVAQRQKGMPITAKKMNELAEKPGKLRIYAGGHTQVDVDPDLVDEKYIINVPSVIVRSRGYIDFALNDGPFTHKNEMWSYSAKSERTNISFIYYYLLTQRPALQMHAHATSVKLPQLSVKDTDNLPIPLPPLEVQEEIVRILDQFVELDRELEAEIQGREKQFEGVRDDLMGEITGRTVQLGDVGSFIRGNGLQKKELRSSGFPAIHYGQIHTHYSHKAYSTLSFVDVENASSYKHAQPGDIILATTSEDDDAVGKATAWLGSNPVAVSGDAFIYQHEFHPLFISFWLGGSDFQYQKQRYISGAKVRRLSGQSLAKIVAPFPPLEVQEEIATKLDTFTDYIDNLKRERELRQKQYEYYRDQLLDFDVKE